MSYGRRTDCTMRAFRAAAGCHIAAGWLLLGWMLAGVAAAASPDHSVVAGDSVCEISVQPQYAALDSPPIAQVSRTTGDAAGPVGAGCFAKSDSVALWVTVAGVIRTSDSWSNYLRRFGAITQLLGAQYWSTTEQKWRPLVSSAYAVGAENSTQPRADYSPAELATGVDRYYRITDTRSGRDVTYRIRLRVSQPGRMVVETTNVEPIKKWGITVYAADGLHTVYFLNERSPGVWAYYSITRVLPGSFLAEGHEKSYINRAVALYRHYVSLPTNAEPPSAP